MQKDDVSGLKSLGNKETIYDFNGPNHGVLESFPNPSENVYSVDLITEEWTSLCPKTGQPDFATLEIVYYPDKKCVETKSLKLYLFSFRNVGAFMENLVNMVMDDLYELLKPHYIYIKGSFKVRGGIGLSVSVTKGELPCE